jgi:hypothetical protein
VLCRQGVTLDFVTKLYECPEFMRYQLLHGLLDQLVTLPPLHFAALVGQALSLGLTTYVDVPAPTLVSLAFTTVFPGRFPLDSDSDEFDAATHPVPLLADYDRAVLSAAAVSRTNGLRVQASRVSLLDPTQSEEPSVHLQARLLGTPFTHAPSLSLFLTGCRLVAAAC